MKTDRHTLQRVLSGLLITALLVFSVDLLHILIHLGLEPDLVRIPGFAGKFAVKLFFWLLPVILLSRRRVWMRLLILAGILFLCRPVTVLAGSGCEHASSLMEKTGMARDASENFFGHVKIKPPHGSYPSDMDKITWWGVFKPFEFWDNPEFEAVWINPNGEEVGKQKFSGRKCKLAKTTMRGEDQPRGEFMPGIWHVKVSCDEYQLDQQEFAVLPVSGSQVSSPDAMSQAPETAMIWAKDATQDD